VFRPPSILIVVGKLVYASWTDAQIAKEQSPQEGDRQARCARSPIFKISKTRKQRLVARMEIIERLQRKRAGNSAPVRRTREDRSRRRCTSRNLKENGNKLEIHGVAQSSTPGVDVSCGTSTGPYGWITLSCRSSSPLRISPTGGSSFTLFADTVGVNLEDGRPKLRSRRLRRNEFHRPTSYSRSARGRRPLAAGPCAASSCC